MKQLSINIFERDLAVHSQVVYFRRGGINLSHPPKQEFMFHSDRNIILYVNLCPIKIKRMICSRTTAAPSSRGA